MRKDTTEFTEVSLAPGGGGGEEGEGANQQALQDALGVETTPASNDSGGGGGTRSSAPPLRGRSEPAGPAADPGKVQSSRVDPGMSVLQDSVLGLKPNGMYIGAHLVAALVGPCAVH